MLNSLFNRRIISNLYGNTSLSRISARSFASGRDAPEESEEELTAAREWAEKLDPKTIPRHIGEVSFSRSSGPGGQNVNKSVVTASFNVNNS